MTRQQNFHKNPHTARFLQTFHSGIGSNGRNYRQEMSEEQTATQFVSGQDYSGQPSFANVESNAPAATQEYFYKGWRVTTGPGFITEAQARFVIDIAETREGVTDAMVQSLAERLIQGFAKYAASQFITKYKGLPKRAVQAGPGEDKTVPVRDAQGVPAGRYAVREDGAVKFYRVTEGKGRWAGRTFIEAQASDDHYPIRNTERRQAILKAIAANPEAAQVLYGQELGHCYRCGRTLTDETSRELGIGPDCRSK